MVGELQNESIPTQNSAADLPSLDMQSVDVISLLSYHFDRKITIRASKSRRFCTLFQQNQNSLSRRKLLVDHFFTNGTERKSLVGKKKTTKRSDKLLSQGSRKESLDFRTFHLHTNAAYMQGAEKRQLNSSPRSSRLCPPSHYKFLHSPSFPSSPPSPLTCGTSSTRVQLCAIRASIHYDGVTAMFYNVLYTVQKQIKLLLTMYCVKKLKSNKLDSLMCHTHGNHSKLNIKKELELEYKIGMLNSFNKKKLN